MMGANADAKTSGEDAAPRVVEPVENFKLLKNALTADDIASLRAACKAHFAAPDAIPSYVLIDRLADPIVEKIKQQMEKAIGEPLFYLNDFFIYTSDEFSAGWHMDTELFTFARAYNAWILLAPDAIDSPLAVMSGKNGDNEDYFHSVKDDGDKLQFMNMTNGGKVEDNLSAIEAARIDAPDVALGDILILNPRRFHRTNASRSKHVLAIKYLAKTDGDILSKAQVPSLFWKEVKFFNKLVKNAGDWDAVIDGIRELLKTEDGREALGAGFFPEKLELYRRAVNEF